MSHTANITFETGKIYSSPKRGLKVMCTNPEGTSENHFSGVLLKNADHVNPAFQRGFYGEAWKKSNFLLYFDQKIAI